MWHLLIMTAAQQRERRVLAGKRWDLWIAPEDGPYFICSDNPLSARGGSTRGIEDPGVVLTFPLHRRAALVVNLGDADRVVMVKAGGVAWVNMLTITGASSFVCSSEDDFVWSTSGNGSDLHDAAYYFQLLNDPDIKKRRFEAVP